MRFRIALLLLALGLPLASAALLPASSAQTTLPPGVRLLQLPTNDLVYDPQRQRIFASVPPEGGSHANTIARINPATGAVESSTFVGEKPGKLAISDNSQYLYVGMEQAGGVRRFDLATQTPGLQWGTPQFFDRPTFPEDMEVIPGRPESVVVSLHTGLGDHALLAVYDDGVQRPKTPPCCSSQANQIEFAGSASTIYTLNTTNSEAGFRRIAIEADGLSVLQTVQSLGLGNNIEYRDGLVYSNLGKIVDPTAMAVVASFPAPNGNGLFVEPDPANHRVYFVHTSGFFNDRAVVRAFDTRTFMLVGELIIPGLVGQPGTLISWGATGLAFRTTGGQLFLFEKSAVPPPPETPRPTPVQVAPGVTRLPLQSNDLAYDPATNRVYASIPSAAGTFGNSVAPIDPATGAMGTPVLVGPDPGKLAIARPGRHLYAGLDSGRVRRFDTVTQEAGSDFPLGTSRNGTLFVNDMEVSPDDPNVVAVSRRNKVVTPSHEGVAVYANGSKLAAETPEHTGSNVIEFSASGGTLYGLDNSSTEAGFYEMRVDAAGVAVTRSNAVFAGAGDIRFAADRVYANNGQVADPSTRKLLGAYAARGAVLPDPVASRVYFMTRADNGGALLVVFDLHTFLPVGLLQVPGATGFARSLVRAGADALAFRTDDGQIFFVQLSAVVPYAPPEPRTVPRADGVRQVSIAANDIVYSAFDGKVYASVPSGAGQRGNSLTQLDPSTGAVGSSVLVGSEPGVLAASETGQHLYVALDGIAGVRRFDVAAQAPGLQFDLGRDSDPTIQHWGPPFPRDLAVVPGNPDAVAVSRYYPTVDANGGVVVYDSGVARPQRGAGANITFAGNSPTLLGFNNTDTGFNLFKMSLGANGLSVEANAEALINGFRTDIEYAAGRVYGEDGAVVDVTGAPARVGRFHTPLGNRVAPDPAAGRVYFIRINPTAGAVNVEAYDPHTFIQTHTLRVTGVNAPVARFFRYGADGLAFLTDDGQVYFLSTGMLQPLAPTPAPTPQQVAEGVRVIPFSVSDIVFDPNSGKIFASVPSRAFNGTGPSIDNSVGAPISFGNGVVAIDPATGAFGPHVFVGSEPQKLAVSPDGQFLYAGLEGSGRLRRVHLPSLTPDFSAPLAPSTRIRGLTNVEDMEVMPGRPGTVAVSTKVLGSPRHVGVFIFDEGVPRPTNTVSLLMDSNNVIEFGPSASSIYGLNNETTAFSLQKLAVGDSGVSQTASTRDLVQGFGHDMEFDNGLLYTTGGLVIDPQAPSVVGSFPGVPNSGLNFNLVLPDSSANRVFFLTPPENFNLQPLTLHAFDLTTRQSTGTLTIPGVRGRPTSLIRCGPNCLAFRAQDTNAGAAGGGQLYIINSPLIPPRVTGPNTTQFASAATAGAEEAREVQFLVRRAGDTSAAATVIYATVPGTASDRADFAAASGRLRFAPGETEKLLTLFITDDVIAEGNETFTVTLSDGQGTTVGANSTLSVTIQDNDTATGPSPVSWDNFNTTFFVRQHYRDFLNRDADDAGLAHWSNEIEKCGADTACREVRRVNVSAAFFLSIESQETGYLVHRTYKAAYGDIPGTPVPVRLSDYLRDTQELGTNVRVGVGNWQAVLEANKRSYYEGFVSTARFAQRYPQAMAPADFVAALDANAGGVLTAGERNALTAELTAAGNAPFARARVLRSVAENAELARREFREAFVLMQYFGYLRRDPDAVGFNGQPDPLFEGFHFWLGKLNEHNGNFVTAEMVKAFIISIEYQHRFGR